MEQVQPFELARLLVGDAPLLFYAEIMFRTVVIYVYTLVLLRWLGGRSIAQLSLVEFLLVIALGSAVGDAMFYPEVPLLHALLVITLVAVIARLIDVLTLRSARINTMVDGAPVQVVRDGVLVMPNLTLRGMSTAELASVLRIEKVRNLGEIRAAYIEPSGTMSVFLAGAARPGLRVEPPSSLEPHPPAISGQPACCSTCGWCVVGDIPTACPNCHDHNWTSQT